LAAARQPSCFRLADGICLPLSVGIELLLGAQFVFPLVCISLIAGLQAEFRARAVARSRSAFMLIYSLRGAE